MKMTNKRHKWELIIIVWLFLSFNDFVFAERPFMIADDIDAAPYISGDHKNKPTGIFYDTARNVFERINVKLKYNVYPWKRAQEMVKDGQADALITIPTPKRLAYLQASREPVFIMKYMIFTQQDNPKIPQIRSIKKLEDLNGLKIIDYLGDGWAMKNLGEFDIYWAPNLSATCKMLAGGRGDVFLQDEMMVWHAIKNIKNKSDYWQSKFDNIVTFNAPVEQIGFHLLVRKDSRFTDVIPRFDETIREMQKDGTLDRIKSKWLN